MSTQDPRWSDDTYQLAKGTLIDWFQPGEDDEARDYITDGAISLLTALADAGLLVPADGETREEWVAESTQPSGAICRRPTTAVEDVPGFVAWMRKTDYYATGHRVLRRVVHTGPWVEVTEVDGSQT